MKKKKIKQEDKDIKGYGSFYKRLSKYTKKNIAKRESRLKRIEELRKIAKENRERQLELRRHNRRVL